MKRVFGRIGSVLVPLLMLYSSWISIQSAYASGAILYELGTPDVGLASAGYAARAQDASTLFKNPAGMSLLEKSELQIGLQAL